MDDLVERLFDCGSNAEGAEKLCVEAADEITRLRAALADAQAVGFAAGVEAAAKRVGFTECPACGGEGWEIYGWEIYDHDEHDCQTCFGRGVVPHLDKSALDLIPLQQEPGNE